MAESPQPLWAMDQYLFCQISSGIRLEIKSTLNVMCLNHSKPSPLPKSMEKLSSTKWVPGPKKVGVVNKQGIQQASDEIMGVLKTAAGLSVYWFF